MAVGTYTLPICDGCKMPWLPVGWSQESDPRNLPSGAKPLRCGKCKSSGWDREHNAEMRHRGEAQLDAQRSPKPSDAGSTPSLSTKITTIHMDTETGIPTMIETVEEIPIEEAHRRYSGGTRCKHRMTDCPICNPKEAA